jgi:integrase
MAQIRVKQKAKVIHTETKTFDRKQAANAWIARRETELRQPGAIERLRAHDPTLAEVIDRYIAESQTPIGRTKASALRVIKGCDIAAMKCSHIKSEHVVAFVRSLPGGPATRQNYLSHLSAVFKLARPAWGYPLDYQATRDAYMVTNKLGVTGKSRSRNRRPTLEELDRLMEHFGVVQARRPGSIPMQRIIPFAIFSTRREDEISRIRWEDYDGSQVLVRDMKHPGEKVGNDTWCEVPPEAAAFINAMPRIGPCIFANVTAKAISAAFTKACYVLGINTEDMPQDERLHFHDLRHEGVSRLFEMGRHIAQAAAVSGHRSWTSLKRYTHLRHTGDKYADWKWRTPLLALPGLH